MKNLLERRTNSFYHAYKIIVAAGKEAGVGAKALEPVQKAMENPLETKILAESSRQESPFVLGLASSC